MNSIWIEEGNDIFVSNITMTYLESPIPPNSFTKQVYGGGFHILNMKTINMFKDVYITGLRADYGGCIYIKLDHHFK